MIASVLNLIIVVALLGYIQGAFREQTILSSFSLPYVHVTKWRPRLMWLRVPLPNISIMLPLCLAWSTLAVIAFHFQLSAVVRISVSFALGCLLADVHTLAAGVGHNRSGRRIVLMPSHQFEDAATLAKKSGASTRLVCMSEMQRYHW